MSTDITTDDSDPIESFVRTYCTEAIEAAITGAADALEVSYRDLGKDPDVRNYHHGVHGQLEEVREFLISN